MNGYCRILKTDLEIEPFVDGVLQIENEDTKRIAINKIGEAERNKIDYEEYPTLTCKDYRDFGYRDNKERIKLRKSIVNELINMQRLGNDDELEFGKGGAKPNTNLSSQKKAFYIIGPPAAGKSGIANKIADEVGAYILDSDYAKRKLPEFKNQISSASLVHEESDALIFNYKGEGENLLKYCIESNYNIVIPKIGNDINKILSFCSSLKEYFEYSIFLISVDLDRAKATMRAYNRYMETKRYVPLALIFDGYGNEPTLNYFKIKQQKTDIFSGYAQISTDVPLNQSPSLKEVENMEFLVKLFGGEKHDL
jgi:hypothetical protein